MNILISGGFGFIGSYMIDNFLKKGHKVGVLVRSIPPYFNYLAYKVEVYLSDITKPISLDVSEKYDIFIHLASANDIDSKDASKALNATTLGTKNCLDFCLQQNIKRFIYFSTFQVYGLDKGDVDENTPLKFKNDYAITHFFAEEYVKKYGLQNNVHYIILRPTNIFGGFLHKNIDRWSLVPNCFCKDAFEKKEIMLLSSGKQKRDFISLEDVSNFTLLCCNKFEENKNEIFNLASGSITSIVDVAKMTKQVFMECFNTDCKLSIMSDEPKDCEHFKVSTQKIQKTGYEYSQNHDIKTEIRKIFKLLSD